VVQGKRHALNHSPTKRRGRELDVRLSLPHVRFIWIKKLFLNSISHFVYVTRCKTGLTNTCQVVAAPDSAIEINELRRLEIAPRKIYENAKKVACRGNFSW
jgi:hypothetical protein